MEGGFRCDEYRLVQRVDAPGATAERASSEDASSVMQTTWSTRSLTTPVSRQSGIAAMNALFSGRSNSTKSCSLLSAGARVEARHGD